MTIPGSVVGFFNGKVGLATKGAALIGVVRTTGLYETNSRVKTVFLSTFQPSRDPSTGWRCHSAGTGGAN